MTLEKLREYDGRDKAKHDGRILLACDGKVFDVTRGKAKYGPGTMFVLFLQSLTKQNASATVCIFKNWFGISLFMRNNE